MKWIIAALALFIAGAVISGAGAMALFWRSPASDNKADRLTERIYFLRDLDIRDEDHPVLVLHERAAGGEIMAVVDPALLRSVADETYFSIDPDPNWQAFTSPHIANGFFASLFTDAEPVRHWTCEFRNCSTSDTPGIAPEKSSLQPLLDHALPVSRVFETNESRTAQQQRVAMLLSDSNVLGGSIEAPDIYADTGDFGGFFQIELPTIVMPSTPPEEERLQKARAERDRMVAELSAKLDGTGLAWRFDGSPALYRNQGPLLRQPAAEGKAGAPILGKDGERIPLSLYEFFFPVVNVAGTKALFAFASDGGLAAIETHFGMDEAVWGQIDALITRQTGEDCKGCWNIDTQYVITPSAKAAHFSPPVYPTSYLRIDRDE